MTADVKIHRNPRGGWTCLLNGEDVANLLTQTGVRVEFTEYNMALVTLTFRTTDIDLDLPGVEVKATAPDWVPNAKGEPVAVSTRAVQWELDNRHARSDG